MYPHLRGFIGSTTTSFQKQKGGGTERDVLAGTDTELMACVCIIDRMGTRIGCVDFYGGLAVHWLYRIQRPTDVLAVFGDFAKDRRS